MKRIYLILLLMLVVFFVVSCKENATETTADAQGEMSSIETTEVSKAPTIKYVYSLYETGSKLPQGEDTTAEADGFYRFSVPDLTDSLYLYKTTTGSQKLTHFQFYEEKKELFYSGSKINFPRFPKEYGGYSIYAGISGEALRTSSVYIRQETGMPIYINETYDEAANRVFFSELDMGNREAVVACASDYLKRYADLEGLTLSVYEDIAGVDVNATDGDYGSIYGIAVEYNLMIGGCKTDCYAKMVIAYDKTAYTITLTNEMKVAFLPFLNAGIDVKRIDGIVSQRLEAAKALDTATYRYDGYDSETVLMVIDGELKAYVTAVPRVAKLSTDKEIACYPIYLLIDIAKIQ